MVEVLINIYINSHENLGLFLKTCHYCNSILWAKTINMKDISNNISPFSRINITRIIFPLFENKHNKKVTEFTSSLYPFHLRIVLISHARHACSNGTFSQSAHCCSEAPRRTCQTASTPGGKTPPPNLFYWLGKLANFSFDTRGFHFDLKAFSYRGIVLIRI